MRYAGLSAALDLPRAEAPGLAQFYSGREIGVGQEAQGPRADRTFLEERTDLLRAATTAISFGPFCLLPSRFLLLEGGNPVPLGSRALEMLTVLLERPGELISKQQLMARVWPNLFVAPANITVHMSALRRTLRDGRDGNRFIINVPGRGYRFVGPVIAAIEPPSNRMVEHV